MQTSYFYEVDTLNILFTNEKAEAQKSSLTCLRLVADVKQQSLENLQLKSPCSQPGA